MIDRTTPPPVRKIKKIACPAVNHHWLANDVPLYTIDDPQSSIIKIEFVFEAGKWYEKTNLTADFANRLMQEGTAEYPAKAIAEKIDYFGANLEQYVSFSSAGFVLYCLEKNVTPLLSVLRSIFTTPLFSQKEINTIATNRKEKWKEQMQKTEYLANRIFLPAMWGEAHPYGRVTQAADFKHCSTADLAMFHRSYYTADRLKIIAAGKITPQLTEQLSRLCEQLHKTTNVPDVVYLQQPSTTKSYYKKIKNATQATILMGCRTITKNHPDYLSLSVLNAALGGYFSSRLMKNIREEKGYTYGIYSAISGYQHGGIFEITAEVNRDFAQKTISEAKNEIKRLQEKKMTQSELTNVQNYMAGRLMRNVDGCLKYSEVVKGMIQFRQSPTFINDYLNTIYATTPDQLRTLANQYLNAEEMYEVIVG